MLMFRISNVSRLPPVMSIDSREVALRLPRLTFSLELLSTAICEKLFRFIFLFEVRRAPSFRFSFDPFSELVPATEVMLHTFCSERVSQTKSLGNMTPWPPICLPPLLKPPETFTSPSKSLLGDEKEIMPPAPLPAPIPPLLNPEFAPPGPPFDSMDPSPAMFLASIRMDPPLPPPPAPLVLSLAVPPLLPLTLIDPFTATVPLAVMLILPPPAPPGNLESPPSPPSLPNWRGFSRDP